MDMPGNDTVTAAGTAVGVLTAIGTAIIWPARWMVGLIKAEEEARIAAVKELWIAVEDHRKEEVAYERRIEDKLSNIATKDDLARQTDQILAVLHIGKSVIK